VTGCSLALLTVSHHVRTEPPRPHRGPLFHEFLEELALYDPCNFSLDEALIDYYLETPPNCQSASILRSGGAVFMILIDISCVSHLARYDDDSTGARGVKQTFSAVSSSRISSSATSITSASRGTATLT